MGRSFDSLVDEAAELSVEGWVFSWLGGRATEERPSWGYQRLLSQRLAKATAALDIQTGGGEVLAGAGAENFPRTLVATEGWPPNVAKATARCFICRRRPDGAVLGLPIRQARRLTGRLRRAHEMTPQPTPGET